MTSQSNRRGGGRSARQKERGSEDAVKNAHLHCAYIKRNIPFYEIANDAQLVMVEKTIDRILAEIGIDIADDEDSVRLFKQAGASVEALGAERWRLKFEPGLIRQIMSTAPATFTQHARNKAKSVEIGGKNIVFAPSYGSPFVMDLDQGRRYGTIQDFQNFIKLAQASPNLHHSGGTICEPTDVAVNKRHLDMVYSHIKYSDRAYLGSITAPERAQDSIEMTRLVFGADFVEKNCCIMGNFNVTSPLVFDGVTTKAIRNYARANQGVVIVPFLLCGAVAPVTTAGAVAQNMAEAMVGVALSQLERKGAPAVLGSFVSSLSLRSGSPTFGTPEPALGSLLIGQLARRLNIPLRCSGNFSTSKLPDAQAMHQSMMSMLAAVQCGANYILHSAGFLDSLLSMSYEKFMLDLDLCGALHSYCAGLEINEDTLGFDALAEGGPNAHMFGTAHTMRYYESAFWDSDLNDDKTWETWSEEGSSDSMTRANAAWKKSLESYQEPPLDESIDEALQDFIAAKKAEMPDAWY